MVFGVCFHLVSLRTSRCIPATPSVPKCPSPTPVRCSMQWCTSTSPTANTRNWWMQRLWNTSNEARTQSSLRCGVRTGWASELCWSQLSCFVCYLFVFALGLQLVRTSRLLFEGLGVHVVAVLRKTVTIGLKPNVVSNYCDLCFCSE